MKTVVLKAAFLPLLTFCAADAGTSQTNIYGSIPDIHVSSSTVNGRAPSMNNSRSNGSSQQWPQQPVQSTQRAQRAEQPKDKEQLPLHTHHKGDHIIADDGWIFETADPNDGYFHVIPAPYGTPSTEHPHWLWNGDGINLHLELGWWPSNPGKWGTVQTQPGMPVPGYMHLVFADYENHVEPEVGYEFSTDLDNGERTNWDVQPLVPRQFENNREIKSLIKFEQKLRADKQALQKELRHTVLEEKNHSPGTDASVFLFTLQVSEAKERDAIETKESDIATVEIQIKDKVTDLIFHCFSPECLSQQNDWANEQLDSLRRRMEEQ